MKFIELMRSVLLSVKTNKFRVFLTSLGIIIGTFTIIMVVGIGKASEQAVADQYKRLSVASITISSSMRGNFGGSSSTTKTATVADMLKMPEVLQDVKSVGVSVRTMSTVAYQDASETVGVMGTNEAYSEITNLTPMYGSYFTDFDSSMKNKVVVLGYNVADYIFNGDFQSAVGSTVLIKGVTFKVMGVLQRIGSSGGIGGGAPSGTTSGGSAFSSSSDDMAFIPYDVALKYATGQSNSRGGFGGGATASYIALANDVNSVKPAIAEIQEYLANIAGSTTAYTAVDAGSSLASAQATAKTMSTLLIAIAAIVLIVSGIGIMNVMMVAVKERTREIGILMAIGAARKDILFEFLAEAVLISIGGGLLGLALSAFAPYVLSYSGLQFLPSADGLFLGLAFSVITGIFFGYYPAHKASKLKPIDALNYE
jgi:putative ABC transport system permease protein